MSDKTHNFIKNFSRIVELGRPNLRGYYRIVRKAKIMKSYAATDGKYYADVQPLRNDETVDENEPEIEQVEIPVIWGGEKRGIVCPPAEGTYCDLEYYDGDPNYPRISNFRWHENGAPEAELDEFVLQQKEGVYLKIDADNNFFVKTDGKVTIEAAKDITIKGDAKLLIEADEVKITANKTETTGDLKVGGGLDVVGDTTTKKIDADGDINATGDIIAGGSNSPNHGH